MTLEIAVLADDLSGALASAAALHAHRLRSTVQWDRRPLAADLEAVVIDMRTRDLHRACERHAERWAAWLTEHGARRLELRIDSTLRGAPARELRGLLTGARLDDAWILAVPASPQAGRITRQGVQLIASDTDAPRALLIAEHVYGHQVPTLDLDVIDAGSRAVVERMDQLGGEGHTRFVADAEHDGHLRTIALAARRIHERGQSLVTLSPGAWLRHHPAPAHADTGIAIVVLGSATAVNQQGFALLRRQAATAVIDACGRSTADPVLASTQVVIVETLRAGADANPRGLSRRAAAAAAEVLAQLRDDGRHVVGVLASGGDTAACLLEHLKPDSLQPVTELAPLCPLGTLIGGAYAGLPLVTKGGLIGSPRTLSDLVTRLIQENSCPTLEPALP